MPLSTIFQLQISWMSSKRNQLVSQTLNIHHQPDLFSLYWVHCILAFCLWWQFLIVSRLRGVFNFVYCSEQNCTIVSLRQFWNKMWEFRPCKHLLNSLLLNMNILKCMGCIFKHNPKHVFRRIYVLFSSTPSYIQWTSW